MWNFTLVYNMDLLFIDLHWLCDINNNVSPAVMLVTQFNYVYFKIFSYRHLCTSQSNIIQYL